MLHQRQWLALVQLQPFRTDGCLLTGNFWTMDHQGRSHRDVPELRLIRQIQAAAQHNPQRFRRTPAPAGEQGIIGANGSTTDDHRIASRPQLMNPVASG